MRWTELEGDYVLRQFTMFDHIPSWEDIAYNVNWWVRQDCGVSNNRSASACRHKYYELKRKQILDSINDLPQEEKYRLIYKILRFE